MRGLHRWLEGNRLFPTIFRNRPWAIPALLPLAFVVPMTPPGQAFYRALYLCSPALFVCGLILSRSMVLARSSTVWELMWFWHKGAVIVGSLGLPLAISPMVSGGITEFAFWAVLFGSGIFTHGLIFDVDADPRISARRLRRATTTGFVLGTIIFFTWHLIGPSPEPGDWWIAPAFATAFVQISLTLPHLAPSLRPRQRPRK